MIFLFGQGTSRGGADIKRIVDRLRLWDLHMLFVLGGNGGNAAANAIQQECERQNVVCSVVGVPKSIDNDILIVSAIRSQGVFLVLATTLLLLELVCTIQNTNEVPSRILPIG